MQFVLQPWELAFAILASWINREQQESNDYLRTENQVLKEYIGKQRILLTDDQRRRLAVKGRVLGRKRLDEVGTLFTPDTILRWHRKLVARKWDFSDHRHSTIGRPRVRQVIVDLVLLHNHRSLDKGRTSDVLSPIRDGTQDSPSSIHRLHSGSA